MVWLGNYAEQHKDGALIYSLAQEIARFSKSKLGVLERQQTVLVEILPSVPVKSEAARSYSDAFLTVESLYSHEFP